MQPTPITHAIHTIVNYIALVHNASLFCASLYKNKKVGRELPNSSLTISMNTAQHLALFGFFLFNLGSISMAPPFIQFIPCQVGVDLSIISYALSRLGVWLFGLYRIHVAFHSQVLRSLGYQKGTLICVAVMFGATFIFFVATSLAIASGQMHLYDEDGEDAFCAYLVSDQGMSFLDLLLDQLMQILLFVLFWRKMKAIVQLSQDVGFKADDKIVAVIRKYTILMGTNLLSTWVTLVMIIFFNPISPAFSALDSMVNMWTILLFDARYDALYRQIFVCCVKRAPPSELVQVVATKTDGQENSKPSEAVTYTTATGTVAVDVKDSITSKEKDPSTAVPTPIQGHPTSTESGQMSVRNSQTDYVVHIR